MHSLEKRCNISGNSMSRKCQKKQKQAKDTLENTGHIGHLIAFPTSPYLLPTPHITTPYLMLYFTYFYIAALLFSLIFNYLFLLVGLQAKYGQEKFLNLPILRFTYLKRERPFFINSQEEKGCWTEKIEAAQFKYMKPCFCMPCLSYLIPQIVIANTSYLCCEICMLVAIF